MLAVAISPRPAIPKYLSKDRLGNSGFLGTST